MAAFDPPSTEPEHIAVSKSKGIQIDWKDGHCSKYDLRSLRDNCPCATCAGTHGDGETGATRLSPFQIYKPALKMLAVEPVGNYAVQITWNDGHSSGIYSFDHLRGICPCLECRGDELRATEAGS
jgi:DUF971 family protein